MRGGSKRSTGLLFMLLLKLEAVLQSCSLIEYEVVRCRVWILEEVSYALKLNCDTRIILKESWFSITLSKNK